MDWFLYDNGIRHERVKDKLDNESAKLRAWRARLLNYFDVLACLACFKKWRSWRP